MSPPKHVDLLVLVAALAVFCCRLAACSATPSPRRPGSPSAGSRSSPGAASREALADGNRQRAMGIVGRVDPRPGLADGHRRAAGRHRRARGRAAPRPCCCSSSSRLLRRPGDRPPLRARGDRSEGGRAMSERKHQAKVLIGLGIYFAIAILLLLIFGSDGKNEAFQPQNEFKLEPWISIHIAGDRPQHQQGGPLPACSPRADDRRDGLDRAPDGSRSRTGSRPRSRSPTT